MGFFFGPDPTESVQPSVLFPQVMVLSKASLCYRAVWRAGQTTAWTVHPNPVPKAGCFIGPELPQFPCRVSGCLRKAAPKSQQKTVWCSLLAGGKGSQNHFSSSLLARLCFPNANPPPFFFHKNHFSPPCHFAFLTAK